MQSRISHRATGTLIVAVTLYDETDDETACDPVDCFLTDCISFPVTLKVAEVSNYVHPQVQIV